MVQVYLHGGWKRGASAALVTYLCTLLSTLSDAVPSVSLWHLVPEAYVECLVATFHALDRASTPSTAPLSPRILPPLVSLLARLVTDARLASPHVLEITFSTLTLLFSQQGLLAAVEAHPLAAPSLLPGLLSAFRAESSWLAVSGILLKVIGARGFWGASDAVSSASIEGTGVAAAAAEAAPGSANTVALQASGAAVPVVVEAVSGAGSAAVAVGSPVLRRAFAALLVRHAPEADAWVDALFGALNWVVTEVRCACLRATCGSHAHSPRSKTAGHSFYLGMQELACVQTRPRFVLLSAPVS